MGKKRIISISTSLTHPVRTKNHSVCQLCLATSPQPLHFFALEPIQHTEHQRNLKSFQDFLWLPKLLEEFDKLIEHTVMSSLSNADASTHLKIARHNSKGHLSGTNSHELEPPVSPAVLHSGLHPGSPLSTSEVWDPSLGPHNSVL